MLRIPSFSKIFSYWKRHYRELEKNLILWNMKYLGGGWLIHKAQNSKVLKRLPKSMWVLLQCINIFIIECVKEIISNGNDSFDSIKRCLQTSRIHVEQCFFIANSTVKRKMQNMKMKAFTTNYKDKPTKKMEITYK